MRVFVPVDDDWDGSLPTTGEKPVPYRAGVPLWHQALPQASLAAAATAPETGAPGRAGEAVVVTETVPAQPAK